MKDVFLGKWWHWLLLVIAVLLLWQLGGTKLHVIHFNAFFLTLLAGTIVFLLVIIFGTRPGERVTRDNLEEAMPDESGAPGD
jgi:uncharacterized membrane protein YhaH (DUF805 family)